LREIDHWLDRFRPSASDDNTPSRFKSALRRIEASIFSFCQYGGAPLFADILCALGQAERELANGEKFREDKNLRPLTGLSSDWLNAAHDGSIEFEIALSLAGIYDSTHKIGPLRANMEPVKSGVAKQGGVFATWVEGGREVVWNSADLARNMVAVLERRLMDGERAGCERLPIAYRRTASLDAVAAFIAGETDDERIAELLCGMVLIDHRQDYPKLDRCMIDAPPLPRSYALFKLLFLPVPLRTKTGDVDIRPEMAILPLLRADRAGDACAIAVRRLHASGLTPMPYRVSSHTSRDKEFHVSEPMRLAAALLIPVSRQDIDILINMVIRPLTTTNTVVG
jgi:CRISPR-associated protein Csx17